MSKKKTQAARVPVIRYQLFDCTNHVLSEGEIKSAFDSALLIEEHNSADSISIWIDGVFDKRYYKGDDNG